MKLVTFAVCLFTATCFAQVSPLILHSAHMRIVIPQRDEHGTHDFRSECCRGGIDHAVLHAAVRRGDTLYVVFTCEGYSRGGAYGGPGGAGWEKQLNWMAIRGDTVLAHQCEDIESWWEHIYGGLGGWQHGVLVWSAEHGGSYDPTQITGYFDTTHPEKGLQKPADKSNQ